MTRFRANMLSQFSSLLLFAVVTIFARTGTYFPSDRDASPRIAALRMAVGSGTPGAAERFWAEIGENGAPLIEPSVRAKGYTLVTFVWHGESHTQNVVIFDGVAGFDAKDRMTQLARTNVWYKTYEVRNDAQFTYNLSPNDPLTSVNEIKGDAAMHDRLAMLQVDPLNPHRCPTTFGSYSAESSFVNLPDAPPLIWEVPSVSRAKGKIDVVTIHSAVLTEDKKLWVYTPPGFSPTENRYPLLVLFDGDRNIMWMPKILDNLIAEKQLPPMVAIMTDESVPSRRRAELPCNVSFADFLGNELVPWSRKKYHTTMEASRTIVAGSSFGGLAAVYAGLRHSEVFGNVVSLSGSFWWKPEREKPPEWLVRQLIASPKLPLRFYLEVGLMESYPMQISANQHMREVLRTKGYPVGYFEYDGGHAFLNWSGGMARSLLFLFRNEGSNGAVH